jgi:hypothetical protein
MTFERTRARKALVLILALLNLTKMLRPLKKSKRGITKRWREDLADNFL